MEWVELYNQMAVDVDMLHWSLDGDIHHAFGANTILHGGAFMVVAISPASLAAATGLTNNPGPFSRRLSNGGGELLLRNNCQLVYPYGPDGEPQRFSDRCGEPATNAHIQPGPRRAQRRDY